MKLLTKELRQKLPKLYSQEKKNSKEVKIIAKFFCPWNQWTWYVTEFDGKDRFFGYVKGQANELGYFSLSELEAIRGPWGMTIERDLYYGDKHTLAEVIGDDDRDA